ncbi:MAG: hypothetical protein KDA84_12490 [Planctomycetaceae bacterium]|nr:hypothetical protein [Planctomycetaceae bacterium]
MKAPATYQGGKSRLAKQIADTFNFKGRDSFWDVCCGSGAISLEMVNRGLFAPGEITMIDAGPWGLLWKSVGEGTFRMRRFKYFLLNIPENPREIKDHLKALSKEPCKPDDIPYVFLILQAGSFGGTAIGYDDDWKTGGFRSYWTPTETSKRRSPVNPMMPMPDTLEERMGEIVAGMRGVKAMCCDAMLFMPKGTPLIYIDPPYADTAGYQHNLDVMKYVEAVKESCNDPQIYISEGKPFPGINWCLSKGRAKGGMNGNRVNANQEWLTLCC